MLQFVSKSFGVWTLFSLYALLVMSMLMLMNMHDIALPTTPIVVVLHFRQTRCFSRNDVLVGVPRGRWLMW